MTRHRRYATLLAAAVTSLWIPVTALRTPRGLGWTLQYGGGQFITYDGTLGGSFTPEATNFKSCGDHGTYYFSVNGNATVRIGINPPSWDANPFYFELIRDGLEPWEEDPVTTFATGGTTARSTLAIETPSGRPPPPTVADGSRSLPVSPTFATISKRQLLSPVAELAERQIICNARGVGPCTPDAIFDLDVQSTVYVCTTKDGQQCNGGIPPQSSYWVTARILDLSRAKTIVVASQLAANDVGPYYSTTGDQTTWVSNGTYNSIGFDSQTPSNYSSFFNTVCPHSFWPTVRLYVTCVFTSTEMIRAPLELLLTDDT
jgi:hypothetical protein